MFIYIKLYSRKDILKFFRSFLFNFLDARGFKLLVSVNYFDQVGQEIFQKRYLKTNFGNTN